MLIWVGLGNPDYVVKHPVVLVLTCTPSKWVPKGVSTTEAREAVAYKGANRPISAEQSDFEQSDFDGRLLQSILPVADKPSVNLVPKVGLHAKLFLSLSIQLCSKLANQVGTCSKPRYALGATCQCNYPWSLEK